MPRILIGLVVTASLALTALAAIYDGYLVEGPAMQPALLHGDRVLAWTTDFEPAAGDIVVARSPEHPDVEVIKRIVGMPGQTVHVVNEPVPCGGEEWSYRTVIALDGAPLHQTPAGAWADDMARPDGACTGQVYQESLGSRSYRIVETYRARRYAEPTEAGFEMEITVPPDHYFLLGDHRDASNDSRNALFGPVPRDAIIGRVDHKYWSSG